MYVILQNLDAKIVAAIGRMMDLHSKEEMAKKTKSIEVGCNYVSQKCDKFCHDYG